MRAGDDGRVKNILRFLFISSLQGPTLIVSDGSFSRRGFSKAHLFLVSVSSSWGRRSSSPHRLQSGAESRPAQCTAAPGGIRPALGSRRRRRWRQRRSHTSEQLRPQVRAPQRVAAGGRGHPGRATWGTGVGSLRLWGRQSAQLGLGVIFSLGCFFFWLGGGAWEWEVENGGVRVAKRRVGPKFETFLTVH